MKRSKWLLVLLAIVLVGIIWRYDLFQTKTVTKPTATRSVKEVVTPPPFDKSKYSLSDPESPWVVVNKRRALPVTYVPKNLSGLNSDLTATDIKSANKLSSEAAKALILLSNSAGKKGFRFVLVSGYRSYATQTTVYASEVNAFGRTIADTESARPGYSEHQTGLSADLNNSGGPCQLRTCFGGSPAGKWLAFNSWKFGFIIRYPAGKQAIVGYKYEPWHIRYLGKDLASEVYKSKLTLEQFFDLPKAPNYLE